MRKYLHNIKQIYDAYLIGYFYNEYQYRSFLILRHRKELHSLFQWRRLFCTVLLCKTMLKSTAKYSQQYNGNVLNKKNK